MLNSRTTGKKVELGRADADKRSNRQGAKSLDQGAGTAHIARFSLHRPDAQLGIPPDQLDLPANGHAGVSPMLRFHGGFPLRQAGEGYATPSLNSRLSQDRGLPGVFLMR